MDFWDLRRTAARKSNDDLPDEQDGQLGCGRRKKETNERA